MEEQEKISFLKKLQISIFKFEDYARLAAQSISKTILYIFLLMVIFCLIISVAITYKFSKSLVSVKDYINNEIETLSFENGTLNIVPSKEKDKPLITENDKSILGKIIIDTRDLKQEEIDKYNEEIKRYSNGIILLKDKIITKNQMNEITTTMTYKDIGDQYSIQNTNKEDIINMLSGSNATKIYITFYFAMVLYLFIVYFSTVLIDAIFLAVLAYLVSIMAKIRLRFSAAYNIAVYSLTLPIILNLVYIIANTLTGFRIDYFQIVYTSIASIYVIASILIIRSDVIKKQMELNKIVSEQEKVRQEMEQKKLKEQEEAEKERLRKEDEKRRQEEKKKEEDNSKKKKKADNKNKEAGAPEGL